MQGVPGFTAEIACNSLLYGGRHAIQLLADPNGEVTNVYPQLCTPWKFWECTQRLNACVHQCSSAGPDWRPCLLDCLGYDCLMCFPIYSARIDR